MSTDRRPEIALPWPIASLLLRADPHHTDLQRLLLRDPGDLTDFSSVAVATLRSAEDLDPDVAAWAATAALANVRAAYWSRPDVRADQVTDHLATEKSSKVRTSIIAARTDLPEEVTLSALRPHTLDGARHILARAENFTAPALIQAVETLATQARYTKCTSNQKASILAAAALPGVGEGILANTDLHPQVRLHALRSTTMPPSRILSGLRDSAVRSYLVPARPGQSDYTDMDVFRSLIGTPVLTPQLAAVVLETLGRTFNHFQRQYLITVAQAPYEALPNEHFDALAHAASPADLSEWFTHVPTHTQPVAAVLVMRHPVCNAETFALVEPAWQRLPRPVRDAYRSLMLSAGLELLSGWLTHTPHWLTETIASMPGHQLPGLIHNSEDPAWIDAVIDAVLAIGSPEPDWASFLVGASTFNDRRLIEFPWPTIELALARGNRRDTQAAAILDVLGESAYDPDFGESLGKLTNTNLAWGNLAQALAATTDA